MSRVAAPYATTEVSVQDDTAKGIVLILLAVALFSAMDAIVKVTAARFSIPQVIFFRSAFAFVPLSIAVAMSGGPSQLRTRRLGYHALRAVLGLCAMGTFFYSLPRMGLAEVIALSFSGPLFIVLLSGPLLGEPVRALQWVAVMVGMVGVLMIVRPGSELFRAVSLLPLAGALCYSFIMVLVRRMGSREGAVPTAVFFTMFTTAASAAVAPFYWTPMTLPEFGMLAAAGLVGGCANLTLTLAFKAAPAAKIAPFEYTALLWGLATGWVFWGEIPDALALAGAGVIVASGLIVVARTGDEPSPTACE